MRNGLMIGSGRPPSDQAEDTFWLLGLHRASQASREDQLWAIREPLPVSKASETLSASQLAVRDVFISSRSWLRFADREVPLPPRGFAPSSCLLQNRQVLLIGDSTVRDLLSWLTDTPRGEPWAVGGDGGSQFWSANSLGCNPQKGSGCADCWACCFDGCAPMAAMKGGRRGMISHSKRIANARHARRSWQDYELVRKGQGRANATFIFSWKPELHTTSDSVAFRTRFCVSPPDVVYLGKGLHDACRHHVDSIDNHTAHARRHLLQLAHTLKCLPSKSLVVLRTPYFVPDDGGDHTKAGASRRVCMNATWEHVRVRAVREVMVRLHESGAFGPNVLLLDAYTLTEAASQRSSDAGLQSSDGHHYPFAIGQIELFLLWYAYERAIGPQECDQKALMQSKARGP